MNMNMKVTATYSIEIGTLLKIEEYAKEHKFKSNSAAVQQLIERGLREK